MVLIFPLLLALFAHFSSHPLYAGWIVSLQQENYTYEENDGLISVCMVVENIGPGAPVYTLTALNGSAMAAGESNTHLLYKYKNQAH